MKTRKKPISKEDELINYVQLLKGKLAHDRLETIILSESALKKDWLKAEEQKAWQDL